MGVTPKRRQLRETVSNMTWRADLVGKTWKKTTRERVHTDRWVGMNEDSKYIICYRGK